MNDERIDAYIWWCGDEVCNCTQPRIERVTPNIGGPTGSVIHEKLWEGTFYSAADADERAEQERELEEAKRERGLA